MVKGQILVAFFLALLAVSLTGDQSQGVGFAKECIDGIDNDSDGSIDVNDSDCLSYPYADGEGETFTQIGADYQSEKYAYSIFDYQYLYFGASDTFWCQQTTYDNKVIEYQALENYSNGKDKAYDDYLYWFAQNCP